MNISFPKRMLLALVVLAVFGGFGLMHLNAGKVKTTVIPLKKAENVAAAPSPEQQKEPAPEKAAPLPDTATAAQKTANESEKTEAPAAAKTESPGQADVQAAGQGTSLTTAAWEPLIKRLAADGIDEQYARNAFAELGSPPLPEFMAQKAIELYGRKTSLAVSEADKLKFAPPDYSRIAGGMTVAAGRRVMEKNAAFFEGLYKRYGVPAPFVVAVLMVETGIGAETGRQSALLALGSMATIYSVDEVRPVISGLGKDTGDLDKRLAARAEWAYNEVNALLSYAKKSGKNAAAIPGSVYGAIGMCQFMPSNIPKFGASTSKKRPTPDVFVFSDAAASVARYLAAHGWKNAQTPKAQIGVLRSYNHSDIYASTVYGVATSLMSPTTHTSAQSARQGGNAVKAARANARASIPNTKDAKPMDELPGYGNLLE